MRKITFFLAVFILLGTAAGGTAYYFSQNSNSKTQIELQNQPELIGPGLLCNAFGTVVGSYSGGGDPATDLFTWKIYGPANDLLFSRGPGAFQSINITFIQNGTHKIELEVSRGGIALGKFNKSVQVVPAPKVTLESEYFICSSQSITVNAIDPSSSNFSSYIFEWKDNSGNILGTSNSLTINQEGEYSVNFFLTNSAGEISCEYELNSKSVNISSFSIIESGNTVCPDGELNFETDPSLVGEWFVQKIGSPSKKSLGLGISTVINPGLDLTDFGDYEVSFILENPNNPSCSPEKKSPFTYNPQPIFLFESSEGASDCFVADGKLILKAVTDLDFISLEGTGFSVGPFSAGDLIEIPNLKSGTYNLLGILGSCSNSLGSVVPLVNRPPSLDFEVTDLEGELCTQNGKTLGSFKVTLKNGPNTDVFYRVLNERGGVAKNEPLPNSDEFIIEIPGGKYFFEIYTENDECILPWSEELDIPGKESAVFTIPEEINICQSYQLTPLTTQPLEFQLIKPDQTSEIKKAGEEFTLNQSGEHILIGFIPNQSDICPTEKRFIINLIDPIDFEAELISEDCTIGNRSYKANVFGKDPSELLFYWRNELDEIIGTGQTLFLPPTSFGDYSLEVQPAISEACPIDPKKFIAKEPVLSVDVTLEATKLCEFGPRAIIDLSTTFPEEVTNIEWRRYDALGNIENLPFTSLQIIVDEGGTYEAAVFSRISSINKDCELGRSTIQVDLIPNKVTFEIPGNLSICDPYALIPQSATPLEFSLSYPDGSVQIKTWNEAFVLDQEGNYIILGYDPDPNSPECPEQKTFEVTINPPVLFQPVLQSISCEGIYEFIAQLDNYQPDSVDYFWRDSNGTLVDTNQIFTTSTYGTFSLEVQPKGSIPCQIQPIAFEAPVPITSVETTIIDEPLCPDQPDASLTLEADLTEVTTIEWWYTDINNNQIPLTSETNQQEILAVNEGTYEVLLINQYDCIIGRDQVLILRSTDAIRPEVEENYMICPRYEIGPQINPGSFASYEWYFQDNLVSTSPTYKPIQIGTYNLVVYSSEGCAYETTFTTEEECELKVVFPNAIQPGNPDKPFLIYTNYLIDELEIWIFSRWGEIIFHCEMKNLLTEESTCPWDGLLNGEKLPPGSYAYRMNFRNNEKNISKEQLGAILVIN